MILKFLCVWKGGGVVFGDGGINNSIILALWNVLRLGKIQFRLGEIQKNYKSHKVIGGPGPQYNYGGQCPLPPPPLPPPIWRLSSPPELSKNAD